MMNLSGNATSTAISTATSSSERLSAPLWERLGLTHPDKLKQDIILAAQFNQGYQHQPRHSRHHRLQEQDQSQHQQQQDQPQHRRQPQEPQLPTQQQQQQQQPRYSLSLEEHEAIDDDDDTNMLAGDSMNVTTTTAILEKRGNGGGGGYFRRPQTWNVDFCRSTIDCFTKYLQFLAQQSQAAMAQSDSSSTSLSLSSLSSSPQSISPSPFSTASTSSETLVSSTLSKPSSDNTSTLFDEIEVNDEYRRDMQVIEQVLLSTKTTSHAVRALLRCKHPTPQLADLVRDMERLMGQITIPVMPDQPPSSGDRHRRRRRQRLEFTDEVSLRLLEANSKAGNVGRAMTLLELRKQYGFRPRRNEFEYAVTSLQAAGLQYRATQSGSTARNVYRTRVQQELQNKPVWLDDPTRWLDAILLNMRERNFPLDLEMANHMIRCFTTTGKSAKALHFFYKVYETYEPVVNLENSLEEGTDAQQQQQQQQRLSTGTKADDESSSSSSQPRRPRASSVPTPTTPFTMTALGTYIGARSDEYRRKIRIKMNPPPPFYKIPSLAKNAKVSYWIPQGSGRSTKNANASSRSDNNVTNASSENTTHRLVKMLRSDLEMQPEFATGLTAAFAFCDSLTMGCAGHDPLVLDVDSYNLLLSACVNHGALFRALSVLRETMPRQGVTPDIVSYNTLLLGLARVGDVTTMMELWVEVQSSRHLEVSPYTVKYMVEGMLNRGDVSGATSFVQAAFNQHVVLPPYPIHLKILEMALGLDLVYEARRYVQFIQQIRKWRPNKYHTFNQIGQVRAHQRQRPLSKSALQRLFRYFGHDLPNSEFY